LIRNSKSEKMKTRNFLIIGIIAAFLSGCVVYSFYPLYTPDDLFANDLLTGTWMQDGETKWVFEHAYFGKKDPKNIDSTSYILTLEENENQVSKFRVHIVKLGGHYFLDFYLEEFLNKDNLLFADFHVVPVHTFAKVAVSENQLRINWFDQAWLEKLIKENKIRIRHENNGDYILLTAGTKELQKFVTKYVNSDEAFKDGMDALLIRK
jgi:hypothetical protein